MSLSSLDNPLVQASPTATFWEPAEPEMDVSTFVCTQFHDSSLALPPLGQPNVCSEESLSMSKSLGEPPSLSVSPDESPSISVSADEDRVLASIGDGDHPDLAKESTKEQAYDEAQPYMHPLPVNDRHTPVGPGSSLNSMQHQKESLRLEFLRHSTFPRNIPKSTIISSVPIPTRTQVESSLQLVSCLSLLSEDPLLYSIGDRDDAVEKNDPSWPWRRWLDEMRQRPAEHEYLRQLVSRMVQVFVENPNKSDLIDEVTILGPALNQVDMNTLLMCLINSPERFEIWSPLDSYLLPAIARLIQTASPGVLINKVVVEILGIFQLHLQDSRVLDRSDVHQLVAKILEVMASGGVTDLDLQQNCQPLMDLLHNLDAEHSDDFLQFNVDYACQAMLYLSGNETPLQTLLRSADTLVSGASDVNTAVKLELQAALAAIDRLQKATILCELGATITKDDVDEARAGGVAGGGDAAVLKDERQSGQKDAWYLALQAACAFVRDGRMVEFSQLVCDVACRFETNFQHGVCQILAEMATDPLWELSYRRRAVDFLGQLFRSDVRWRQGSTIVNWIATIVSQAPPLDEPYIILHARLLLEDLQQEFSVHVEDHYSLCTTTPLLTSFPLLDQAKTILKQESYVARLLSQGAAEKHLSSVYIPLNAKSSLLDANSSCFPLMEKVSEFLDSDRRVFLITGDTGSGKSKFCKHLHRELWRNYKEGGWIPLHIDLPSIDRPERDLIKKHLRQRDFLVHEIKEMLRQQRFVLICDGYDECRLTTNLYTTNLLHQLRHQDIKMVITCRTNLLSLDYHGRFRPQSMDHYYENPIDQLQEATIVPFTLTEISAFVDQSIRLPTAPGKTFFSSTSEFINIIRTIPDLEDLVKNPFVLELALEVLPSLSSDDLGAINIKATRLQLYGEFINHWVRINKSRLERSTLSKGLLAAFESLKESGLEGCVIDFMKELAEAIYDHQDGCSVVEYIHRRDAKSWKAIFFGPAKEPTLLREASPLIRIGLLRKFLHHSFLEYFYSLTFDDSTDDGEDPADDGDDPADDVDDPADDGDGGSDNKGHVPDNDGDDSQGGGSGGAGSKGEGDDSTGGHGGSGGCDGASGSNQSSGGNEGGSGGDEEGSRRCRGGSHSKGKGISSKSGVDALMSRFSKRNLFKEPGVMEFLVERTQSNARLRNRLWTIIEQSNRIDDPCLAAANAIAILFKTGERFLNDSRLNFITIPRDYISEGAFDPAHKLRSSWNGTVLLTILLEMADPAASWKLSSRLVTIPLYGFPADGVEFKEASAPSFALPYAPPTKAVDKLSLLALATTSKLKNLPLPTNYSNLFPFFNSFNGSDSLPVQTLMFNGDSIPIERRTSRSDPLLSASVGHSNIPLPFESRDSRGSPLPFEPPTNCRRNPLPFEPTTDTIDVRKRGLQKEEIGGDINKDKIRRLS